MASAPRGTDKRPAEGLSLQTLLVASAASVAAAVFTHMLWKGGAIVGAAITPVIVAVVSETLRRPTQVITAVRPVTRERRGGSRGAPGAPPIAPPPGHERPDPFGIWAAERRERSWWERIKGRPLKIALATGAAAFAIGAFALTATELVFGGSVAGGGDRTTIIPVDRSGGSGAKGTTTTETTRTTETVPPATTETVPPATTETVPPVTTETVPPATTETVPPVTTTPPTATTPAAPGGTPAPAPAPAG